MRLCVSFSGVNEANSHVSDITTEFKVHLRELIPLLLGRQNLVVKKIHGNAITGRELIEYFKVS